VPLTSGTTGRLKHNKSALMAAPIAIAPLDEQVEIVRPVEALFKLADAIERRVVAAATRADKPTQAILARAFPGEAGPDRGRTRPLGGPGLRARLGLAGTHPRRQRPADPGGAFPDVSARPPTACVRPLAGPWSRSYDRQESPSTSWTARPRAS
jgi:hypothetical protein